MGLSARYKEETAPCRLHVFPSSSPCTIRLPTAKFVADVESLHIPPSNTFATVVCPVCRGDKKFANQTHPFAPDLPSQPAPNFNEGAPQPVDPDLRDFNHSAGVPLSRQPLRRMQDLLAFRATLGTAYDWYSHLRPSFRMGIYQACVRRNVVLLGEGKRLLRERAPTHTLDFRGSRFSCVFPHDKAL